MDTKLAIPALSFFPVKIVSSASAAACEVAYFRCTDTCTCHRCELSLVVAEFDDVSHPVTFLPSSVPKNSRKNFRRGSLLSRATSMNRFVTVLIIDADRVISMALAAFGSPPRSRSEERRVGEGGE